MGQTGLMLVPECLCWPSSPLASLEPSAPEGQLHQLATCMAQLCRSLPLYPRWWTPLSHCLCQHSPSWHVSNYVSLAIAAVGNDNTAFLFHPKCLKELKQSAELVAALAPPSPRGREASGYVELLLLVGLIPNSQPSWESPPHAALHQSVAECWREAEFTLR